ncbi:LysR family transcriptional regulator [Embleya sp. NPDC127516]|uniref:LysR family transcriptional regulator n=1 Tax=Embleya sp. NPDC127516 TaxID=3363990 RepID=UPI003812AED9
MEIFLTLSEELHFGRTATRLYVSTAQVSTTIKKIERRLGVTLFERTSRRVELTTVGRGLRDDLVPLYEGIQRAMDRAELAGRGITGTLTVGFMGIQAGRFVTAAREVFERRNPDCAVHVVETLLHHHVGQLRDGDADLLLITLPVDEPDLTIGPVITRSVRYMALPAKHRLAGRDMLSFEDLAGEAFVTMADSVPGSWADFHTPRRTPAGRVIGRRGEPCATYPQALAQVAAGRAMVPGDAQLPMLYQHPEIRFVPAPDMPPIEHGLVWRSRDDADTRIRAFSDVILEIAPALAVPGTIAAFRGADDEPESAASRVGRGRTVVSGRSAGERAPG